MPHRYAIVSYYMGIYIYIVTCAWVLNFLHILKTRLRLDYWKKKQFHPKKKVRTASWKKKAISPGKKTLEQQVGKKKWFRPEKNIWTASWKKRSDFARKNFFERQVGKKEVISPGEKFWTASFVFPYKSSYEHTWDIIQKIILGNPPLKSLMKTTWQSPPKEIRLRYCNFY